MSTARPRLYAALGLLALVPVVAFFLGRGAPEVALSAACVLLIAGSLYSMFGEAEAVAAPS